MSIDKKTVQEFTTYSVYIEIYGEQSKKNKIGTATGFLVRKGEDIYLITNKHVVTGTNVFTRDIKGYPIEFKIIVHVLCEDDGIISFGWDEKIIHLYDSNGDKQWVENKNEYIDVVSIKLTNDSNSFSNYVAYDYTWLKNPNCSIVDKLYIIGFPFGHTTLDSKHPLALWISGSVASEPDFNYLYQEKYLPIFLIDARTKEGLSGSPIIEYNNSHMYSSGKTYNIYKEEERGYSANIVGIYSGRINSETDLGFAWRIDIAKELIDMN